MRTVGQTPFRLWPRTVARALLDYCGAACCCGMETQEREEEWEEEAAGHAEEYD